MAQIDLGSIKFNWKGSYSGATAYVVDDVVESSGSSYICIAATTGNAPPNATYWEQMSAKGTDGTNGTDGTDLTTTLTTQGDIVYRNASGLVRLGAGTSGQVLQTGGTGANPSWGTVSSDYVLLGTTTPTTMASSISIDGYFSSTYDNYKIIINDFLVNSISAQNYEVKMRVNASGSADGNTVYNVGWVRSYVTSSSSAAPTNEAHSWDSNRLMFNYGSTTQAWSGTAEINIFIPLDTSNYKKIFGTSLATYDTTTTNYGTFFMLYKNTQAISGITIYTDNLLKASKVKIYGLK